MNRHSVELSTNRWTFLAEGLGGFRAYALFWGFVIGGVIWIGIAFRNDISQRVTELAVLEINSQLADTGWQLAVGRAQMLTSDQVKISNILLYPIDADQPAIAIDAIHLILSDPWKDGEQPVPKLTAIVIDRTTIHINARVIREASLEPLFERLKQLSEKRPSDIELRIRKATCRVIEPQHVPEFELRDVNSVTSKDGHKSTTVVRCESDYFRQWIVNFEHAGEDRPWKCTSFINHIGMDEAFLDLIPEAERLGFDAIHHLSGSLDVAVELAPNDSGEIDFQVRGSCERMNILHEKIATPISNGRFDFEVNKSGLALTNIQANIGDGICRGSFRLDGLSPDADYQFQGEVDNLAVNPQFGEVLSESGKKFLNDFSPVGLVSMRFNLNRHQQQTHRWIHAQVKDLSASFIKFPYRVENLVGNVIWENERCEIDLQTLLASEIATMKGVVLNPGPHATVDIAIDCPGSLPIDEKLFQAMKLYPTVYRQIMALKPRGQASVSGKIHKATPDSPLELSYLINLKQCFVRHDLFDYPFRNVNGQVLVRDQHIVYQNITGENLDSRVTCNGTWDPEIGLALRFWARNVVLDEQLRAAVPQMAKEAWKELRPSGRIPIVRLELSVPSGSPGPPHISLILDSRSNGKDDEQTTYSIKPVAFPYEIQDIRGLVSVIENRIEMTDIEAHHDQAWMRCQGAGSFSDAAWQVRLYDILTGAIPVDHKLLYAMPSGLQSAIRHIDFRGNANISGALTISGQVIPPSQPNHEWGTRDIAQVSFINSATPNRAMKSEMEWDIRIDVVRGKMTTGIDINEIHGNVKLQGRYDGQQAISQGSLEIDSLTLFDAQVTKIRGPIWIDEHRVGVGMFARPENTQTSATPSSLTGQVFGGVIEFDGQTWHEQCQKFYLQTTIDRASLRQAAANFAPSYTMIDGRGQLALRLHGDCASVDSFQGDGVMKMYQAKIHELPVLLATLKQIRRFNEDKSAFDSGNIDFAIKGRSVLFSRMELLGEPISLIGNGQVDFNQNVDLNFYTIAGRNRFYVPVLSELYKAGSQQIMWINVGGTLQSPKSRQEILPGVNESLKELFR